MNGERITELVGYVCLTLVVIAGMGFAYAACKVTTWQEIEKLHMDAEKYEACVSAHNALECKP
jgi:hypothetical protein